LYTCCGRASALVGYDAEYAAAFPGSLVAQKLEGLNVSGLAEIYKRWSSAWPEQVYLSIVASGAELLTGANLLTAKGRIETAKKFYEYGDPAYADITTTQVDSPEFAEADLRAYNISLMTTIPSHDGTFDITVWTTARANASSFDSACQNGIFYETQAGGMILGMPTLTKLASALKDSADVWGGCFVFAMARQTFGNRTSLFQATGDVAKPIDDTAQVLEYLSGLAARIGAKIFAIGGVSAAPKVAALAAHKVKGTLPRKPDVIVMNGPQLGCDILDTVSYKRVPESLSNIDWTPAATRAMLAAVTDPSTQCEDRMADWMNVSHAWWIFSSNHDPFHDAALNFYQKLHRKNEYVSFYTNGEKLGHVQGCLSAQPETKAFLTKIYAASSARVAKRPVDPLECFLWSTNNQPASMIENDACGLALQLFGLNMCPFLVEYGIDPAWILHGHEIRSREPGLKDTLDLLEAMVPSEYVSFLTFSFLCSGVPPHGNTKTKTGTNTGVRRSLQTLPQLSWVRPSKTI
jgi:hypothetical protein